jgi:quercetin dioxygenase-like cupin family protein
MSVVAVVGLDELPFSEIAREFVGEDQGGAGVSFLLVQAPPGRGPSLHRHDYAEVIIVQAGEATFRVGDDELHAAAGDVIVIPAGVPHAFTNTGDDMLRQIDIHASGHFETEWL